MIQRFFLWLKTHRNGGKDARDLRREMRREAIKDNKKEIMRDLMTGHNVGDFQISNEDLGKILKFGDNPAYASLLEFYKKYRGNDLTYRQ